MRSVSTLPEGYREYYSIDLQKDKKAAIAVNVIALIIAAIMVVPMCFAVPISPLFDMSDGIGIYFLRLAALILLIVLYMLLHELVHGAAMKLCGTKRVKYGFTGMYAFAGSEDYYGKGAYIFIALAPIVLLGAAIAVVNFLIPTSSPWFWIVYFIQVNNVSGAAGDLFVTFRFARFPSDILVRDHGVGMCVYSRFE